MSSTLFIASCSWSTTVTSLYRPVETRHTSYLNGRRNARVICFGRSGKEAADPNGAATDYEAIEKEFNASIEEDLHDVPEDDEEADKFLDGFMAGNAQEDFSPETRFDRVAAAAKALCGVDEDAASLLAARTVDLLARRDRKAEEEDRRTGVYAPLHVHSDFSLLDGASKLPALVKRAEKLRCPALALTDHGAMYGAIQLIKACKGSSVKPIVGNEMYVVNATYDQPDKKSRKKYHQVVLAKNDQGYRNLVRITTESHLRGGNGPGWFRRPCVDKRLLAKHKEGLIITSACIGGEIPQALLAEDLETARHVAAWYRDNFKDNFYLELQDHGLKEDRIVNRGLVMIAKELGIKLIATNDSHFTACDDYRPHDALICINTNAKYASNDRLRYSGLEYFRPYSEMIDMFEDHLDRAVVKKALANTLEIQDKVEGYDILGSTQIPRFPVPEGTGWSHKEYLGFVAMEGLRGQCRARNITLTDEYRVRLEYELEMIDTMGFNSYFLVVWDFIKYARDHEIPVGPGRGSAAGCLVAFALGITSIDPVHHGLLFERFLNPERKSMPDIDTDFSVEGRERVISYVSERYGADHVAQIITFNRLTSRAVLRDVARVLGVPLNQVDRLSRMIPVVRGKPAGLEKLISDETPARDFLGEYSSQQSVQELVDTARTIEGLNKSYGIHAAGVVISAAPLYESVPLSRGKHDEVITQYAMEDVESLGLLKMDFLGLKTLSIIEETVRFVNKKHEKDVGNTSPRLTAALEDIDLDDKKTYELLATGDLDGIFQLDASSGMQTIVRQLRPTSIADISSILALYRPGPLDAGLIPKFINRKHGKETIEYDHELLIPILQETYGVLVYQEQIMKTAQVLAGYSLGQADILRRAMGKKNMAMMEKEKPRFIDGAIANGVDKIAAERLFDTMAKFAEYCFNKSHSTAYAMLTFQTAYLKAHFPLEFLTALLKANAQTPDKLQRYISDAVAIGVPVLAPSINESDLGFSPIYGELPSHTPKSRPGPHKGAIRFGLDAIKGVGEASAHAIVEERNRGGPYRSLIDTVRRHSSKVLSKRTLEPLIQTGAFDGLHDTRKGLMDLLPDILKARQKATTRRKKAEKKAEQSNYQEEEANLELRLGAEEQELLMRLEEIKNFGDYDTKEKLDLEKQLLGFYASAHPLRYLRHAAYILQPDCLIGVVVDRNASDDEQNEMGQLRGPVPAYEHGREMLCMGLITSTKQLTTKKSGDKMAKISLEDPSATADCIIYPHVYRRCQSSVAEGQFVCVWGELSRDDMGSQIVVDEIRKAEDVQILVISFDENHTRLDLKKARDILIHVGEASGPEALRNRNGNTNLPFNPRKRSLKGRVPVLIEMAGADFEAVRTGSALYPRNPSKVIDSLRAHGIRSELRRLIRDNEIDESFVDDKRIEAEGRKGSIALLQVVTE